MARWSARMSSRLTEREYQDEMGDGVQVLTGFTRSSTEVASSSLLNVARLVDRTSPTSFTAARIVDVLGGPNGMFSLNKLIHRVYGHTFLADSGDVRSSSTKERSSAGGSGFDPKKDEVGAAAAKVVS